MISDLMNTARYYQADIYEQIWVSMEAIFGALFISIVAGFLIGLMLFKLKRVTGIIALLTWPLRITLNVMGSYPIVVMGILFIPIGRDLFDTPLGAEMGQFVLMVWGIFFFGKMINRSFSDKDDDERLPLKMIENIRLLLIMLISGNAVLGMLGMGGLGEMLVILAYQRLDTSFGIIVGLIYLASILFIEIVFAVVLAVVRTQITPKTADITNRVTNSETTENSKESGKDPQTGLSHNEIHNQASSNLDFLIRKK